MAARLFGSHSADEVEAREGGGFLQPEGSRETDSFSFFPLLFCKEESGGSAEFSLATCETVGSRLSCWSVELRFATDEGRR